MTGVLLVRLSSMINRAKYGAFPTYGDFNVFFWMMHQKAQIRDNGRNILSRHDKSASQRSQSAVELFHT